MLTKFQNHIDLNFPQLKDKKLFLAVSGGIDSMVLVHLCAQLQLNFEVLHCNFQLRGAESDADLQFVASYCQQQAITIHTQAFDTAALAAQNKESIQVTARNLRYQWFYEKMAATNCKYLLTAHHLDELA